MEKRDNCLNYILKECKMENCPFGHVIVKSKVDYVKQLEMTTTLECEFNFQRMICDNMNLRKKVCFYCEIEYIPMNKLKVASLFTNKDCCENCGVLIMKHYMLTRKNLFLTQVEHMYFNNSKTNVHESEDEIFDEDAEDDHEFKILSLNDTGKVNRISSQNESQPILLKKINLSHSMDINVNYFNESKFVL